MRKIVLLVVLGVSVSLGAGVTGCSRDAAKDALEIPTGSDVTVQKRDGVTVAGRLIEVKPQQVVLESASGVKTTVPRADIVSVRATPAATPSGPTPAPLAESKPEVSADTRPDTRAVKPEALANAPAAPAPVSEPVRTARTPALAQYREVAIPAGTLLPLQLTSSIASDTSTVEDKVSATLRSSVRVDGMVVLPAGTAVTGHVTSADASNKVKGRASIAFRFNELDLPGQGGRESIRTATITRVAEGTKKKDAKKIGVGAGAGAVIGGILGGGSGAAKGAVIGGGAGTAAVLATRGDEVRLGPGAQLSATLTAPVTVRVPVK